MAISFICVNYNSTNYSVAFVESIRSNNHTAEIVIVDNSSTEVYYEKLKFLLKAVPNIKLIRQDKNNGYFSALNFGLAEVEKNKIIVVGNNDLKFDFNFISNLELSKYENDVAIICPNVITAAGRHQNPHVLTRMSKTSIFKLDLYYSNYYVAAILNFIYTPIKKIIRKMRSSTPMASCYTHMGIGACYIINPIFWKHYENLEFPFFLYGEEAFLSNQVHKIGYKLYYDANLIVHHAESGTLSLLPKRKTYEFAKAGYPTYRSYL